MDKTSALTNGSLILEILYFGNKLYKFEEYTILSKLSVRKK